MKKSALPGWIVALFAIAAVVLVPWTVGLLAYLPERHLDRHYDLAWAGFDAMMVCCLGLTAFFAWRRSGWVVVSASASAMMLFTDAWFDTLTASTRMQYLVALVTAACFEVPLALLCLWVAIRSGNRYFSRPRAEAPVPEPAHRVPVEPGA